MPDRNEPNSEDRLVETRFFALSRFHRFFLSGNSQLSLATEQKTERNLFVLFFARGGREGKKREKRRTDKEFQRERVTAGGSIVTRFAVPYYLAGHFSRIPL